MNLKRILTIGFMLLVAIGCAQATPQFFTLTQTTSGYDFIKSSATYTKTNIVVEQIPIPYYVTNIVTNVVYNVYNQTNEYIVTNTILATNWINVTNTTDQVNLIPVYYTNYVYSTNIITATIFDTNFVTQLQTNIIIFTNFVNVPVTNVVWLTNVDIILNTNWLTLTDTIPQYVTITNFTTVPVYQTNTFVLTNVIQQTVIVTNIETDIFNETNITYTTNLDYIPVYETNYIVETNWVTATNSGPIVTNIPPSSLNQTNLDVTAFGAIPDDVRFNVDTVSNSPVVTIDASSTYAVSTNDIGKVIELFGAGPQVSYNGQVVVQTQDLIGIVTNVQGNQLFCSLPAGTTTGTSTNNPPTICELGHNNAPNIQAAIDDASAIINQGIITNVVINIPEGTYLLASSNILDPNYEMDSISDTHAELTLSCGGISLISANGNPTNTILRSAGAAMNHIVSGGLTWISPTYAPYNIMRDTAIICQGPVANNQLPLVISDITIDGGVLQGQQSYDYWIISQANGSGWDTSHHGIADSWGPYNSPHYADMFLNRIVSNCIFQHYRGEILICWTGRSTNCVNNFFNDTFLDGNATADNMYYAQNIYNCNFQGVAKIMEYYQANGGPVVISNCVASDISELAGSGNVHYDIAVTGATINSPIYPFTIEDSIFYDDVSMDFVCLNAARNFNFSNNFCISSAGGTGIVLTYAGQQPSDGTQVQDMENIYVGYNTFWCGYPFGDQGFPVQNVLCEGNTNFSVSITTVYANNVDLRNNVGENLSSEYDVNGGPAYMSQIGQQGITGGQFINDETNNQWVIPSPYPPDAGDYNTNACISLGNGRQHELQVSGAFYSLDDSTNDASLIPIGSVLQVAAWTWDGHNVTNFWTSVNRTPATQFTITNATGLWDNFVWTGTNYTYVSSSR